MDDVSLIASIKQNLALAKMLYGNIASKWQLKGEREKFFKNCQLTSYAIGFGQRTFFSIINLIFREKHEFYIFYNSLIFKFRILFK